MMTVFIGGSRAVSKLNGAIRKQLDDFIARRCTILIGDANGADKSVQQHFADRGYGQVIVYCMDQCRNNIGAWQTKPIRRPGAPRDFSYYAEKDRAMAEDAKCGVMFWDARSKGTLNNIQNILSLGKKVLVYFAPEQTFYKLSSESELDELLRRCARRVIEDARQQIRRKVQTDNQPSLHPTPR